MVLFVRAPQRSRCLQRKNLIFPISVYLFRHSDIFKNSKLNRLWAFLPASYTLTAFGHILREAELPGATRQLLSALNVWSSSVANNVHLNIQRLNYQITYPLNVFYNILNTDLSYLYQGLLLNLHFYSSRQRESFEFSKVCQVSHTSPNLDSSPQERLLYPPRVLYLTIHVYSTQHFTDISFY